MKKLILILLVAGGVVWDIHAHRPVPPRNPLRLQRMAPRAPLHPRPPRHHQHQHQHQHPHQHQLQQQAQHSNVIHTQQQHVPQHAGKPHHRSFKPRIHIPLLHGLHHRPLLARLHPHYHHHHHPPHHQHHHGPQHHPAHQHSHHHPHAHHPQQQHHHGRPGQQLIPAGAQLPRIQPNGYPAPGMKPQQQQQHQHQQQHFGFPAIDATPAHTSPAAFPAGPQKHPIRHFPNQHHFNFQQDPEIPFGNEPVSELPTSTAPYQGPGGQSIQPGVPQTTSAYGDTSANPHGFLASTYKGWKPIAKPYQSSYPRAPEHQHQHQHQPAGLPDFPRGPHGFPAPQGFPRGPQDFPQLSDNHLPSFPIHDFPSGPTGPPSHQQDFPRGPHGNNFDVFPEPPPQGFTRAPQNTGNHGGGDGNHLLDFSQFNGGHDGHLQHFPQGPPSRPHGHNHRHHHQQQHPGSPAGKHPQFQQHTSSPPNHLDFGIPPGHSSTTPRHEFPQFFPNDGPLGDNFNNLNTNTLFRENTANMNPHQNQQQGNSQSQSSSSIEVPLPPEIGDSVRLPNSIFSDNTWTQNNNQPFETSQSEENVVIRKPKFGGRHKLNSGNHSPPQPSSAGSSDETVENHGPSVLPKFRPRPRPNKNNDEDNKSLDNGLRHQDSDNERPQKLSTGSDEGYDNGSGQNIKTKLNNGRGRVRIRTRLRRPNPFSNIEEENDSSAGPGSNSKGPSSIFPPFPGTKNESPRPRNPFRKPHPSLPPPHDNSISTETPNSSAGEPDSGPVHRGRPESPGIKGPISEELSNFPTLPFPPPEHDFIRDFPSPVSHAPVSPPPSPPPPPSPQRERELNRLPPPFGRLPVGIRGNPESTEQSFGPAPPPSPPPPPPPPPRDNSQSGPRPHLRRRRPKQPPKIQQEINDIHNQIEHVQQDQQLHQHQHQHQNQNLNQNQQQNIHGVQGNELNNPSVLNLGLGQSLFSDEFFFPPGFNPDPSKHNAGDNPVSFITMPNAKPHIIHHNIVQQQQQQQQQQQHTSSSTEQTLRPQTTPQQNIFQVPTTQHFPPLEEFGGQNLGINQISHLPYLNRHHLPQQAPHQNHHVQQQQAPHQNHHIQQQVPHQNHHIQQQAPHQNHHNHGHVNPPPNGQLPAFSDHLPFRPPSRGRKPPRKRPSSKAPPPPPAHNPYAFPASNPYVVAGQYIPPTGHQLADSAPQTSNSYEIPEGGPVFNGNRQPQAAPVYHPPSHAPPPPPPPPPTQQHVNHHRHHHGHPAPPPPLQKHNIGLPGPSPLPPPRHGPINHGQAPARGRFPGGRGPHHRKPIVPALLDPLHLGQSAEFEQIPAQYVDVSGLGSTTPAVVPSSSPVVTQARPVFSKPHVHHSPDIHPPGSFFDDFFKPFDDAFGQNPQGASVTQRSDGDPMHDEHQSQSNVQVNVVPSPKNFNQSKEAEPNKGGRKHWSKLKVTPKEEKATPGSMEKPGRVGKKPITGRFNNPNNKSHLKAKIADIARKNFQNHLSTANGEPEGGPETVTTYKPALTESSLVSNNASGIEGEHGPAVLRESTTTLKVIPTWEDPEDDVADTNTPKSVRYGTKTEGGPMLIHHRNRNNEDQDGTTILFKSKRQFRRKRPGQLEKDDHHDEPTGRPSPLRQPKQEIDHNHSGDNEDNANAPGSETTRVGVIRRRKLFPRRRNFSLSSKTKDGESSTTPDAPDAESVTYGEGQWFRVKKFESSEDDKPNFGEHGRTLDKESLNNPGPTPESKTAAELPSSHVDEGSSSKDTKSRKMLHSESTTSSVSTSVSSSSSTSSTSTSRDDRPFGKKSSKFLMNRLSIA